MDGKTDRQILFHRTLPATGGGPTKMVQASTRSGHVRLFSNNHKKKKYNVFFQGDSLSPLVFVLALIPLSLILRKAKGSI